MRKKEYGGYLELDRMYGAEFHDSAVALNCGRNCLAYLLKAKKIRKIFLPFFLCASVAEVCRKYGVAVEFYLIDRNFRPLFSEALKDWEYLYLVNYYGQIGNAEIAQWKRRYPNLIVDNSQAFFQKPYSNTDTLYTCRKFFGVADGAYLYTDVRMQETLETDYSYDRMSFVLGRFEKGANEFYKESVRNNQFFRNEPVKYMSALTRNLLRGIDYEKAARQRQANFVQLQKLLEPVNKLELATPEGPYMYPLWIENGAQIRKELLRKKIYIPVLWPDVLVQCAEQNLEYEMANNILPIPVDQRYDEADMQYLAEVVLECIG